ncbi:MAG: NAD(P)H:quinone oxidoreductase [Methanobacteriota archaeon]
MRVLVIFYSMYGHVFQMAEAIVDGVKEVEGVEVELKKVRETITLEVLEKSGALKAQKAFEHVPEVSVDDLALADAIIFGTPTRFGNMAGQMRQFLDTTGSLWANDGLVGKVGGVFTCSATQHGGQETTITSFHTTLLHLGMIIVGLPYSYKGQLILDEIAGGSPYGASTISGPGKGERNPSENELATARFQGKYVADIARKIEGGGSG